MRLGRERGLAARLLALALTGCWTPIAEPIPDTRTRYDEVPPADRPAFEAARDALDDGRAADARAVFEGLAARHPDCIVVGAWLQETELALARDAAVPVPVDRGRSEQEPTPKLEALRLRYRERAEREPTPANLVLAARVEHDPLAALILLDAAAASDPDCAWAHYGRAFLAAQQSDWPEVRNAIARAKQAEPGHLPTRWLEAWMLARGASVPEAIVALEAWIEKARDDRRIDRRLTLEAQLDLALLSIQDGDPDRARKLLAQIEGADVEQGRLWMAVASAEQASGEPLRALEAALVAERLAPGLLLPLVQQALLYDLVLRDHEAAEAAWTRVLAISRGKSDLSALLERMRARVRLERFQRSREQRARGDGDATR